MINNLINDIKDIKLKTLLCNLSYIILIVFIGFIFLFAIKTREKYNNVQDVLKKNGLLGEVIEGFSNMDKVDKDNLLEKLDISTNDIDIVKNNRKKKLLGTIDEEELREYNKSKELIDKPSKIINIPSDKIFDEYYASLYDKVTFDYSKVLFESHYINELIKKDKVNGATILDVGCGTGQHIKPLAKDNNIYVGLDKSNAMLEKAKKYKRPNVELVIGDAMNSDVVEANKYTHIICLYFSIYYMNDPEKLFNNFSKWLKPGGLVICHLVDRDLFDPVLNPANPSQINSIQKYSKKRITTSIIKFNKMTYISDFVLKKNNMAEFQEIIRYKKDSVERRHRHKLYMYTNKHYVQIAKKTGFELKEIKNMKDVKYEHNYLFVFRKK